MNLDMKNTCSVGKMPLHEVVRLCGFPVVNQTKDRFVSVPHYEEQRARQNIYVRELVRRGFWIQLSL